MEGLGERLRQFRKERKWSLEDLALRATIHLDRPIHHTTIGKIERSERKPSGEILVALAEALHISVNKLTGKYDGKYLLNEYQVPIIEFLDIEHWPEAINSPLGHIFSIDFSGQAFAVKVEDEVLNGIVQGDNTHVVIAPSETELLDGRIYAIVGEGKPSLQRFRHSPPSFEQLSSISSGKIVPLGQIPFKVIGRAIWIAADL